MILCNNSVMNYQGFFKYYGDIPSVSKDKYWRSRFLYSTRRYFVRRIFTRFIFPVYFRKYHIVYDKCVDNTIISLTSFPKRLSTLWLVVESLKRQTIRPYKIILYLSNQEVSKADLPSSLLKEEDELFEIRFRDGKMRAHGKYYFAICDFPNKNIVTVDDDIVYSPKMLEYLLNGHMAYPNDVITNCSRQILLDSNGNIEAYKKWKIINNVDNCSEYYTHNLLIPMGVGGVLYPSNSLYKDALNFELAKKLSYLADDLWLYSQIVLAGRKVIKTAFDSKQNIPVYIKDNVSLSSVNVGQNKNDEQMIKLREYYLKTIGKDIAKI